MWYRIGKMWQPLNQISLIQLFYFIFVTLTPNEHFLSNGHTLILQFL